MSASCCVPFCAAPDDGPPGIVPDEATDIPASGGVTLRCAVGHDPLVIAPDEPSNRIPASNDVTLRCAVGHDPLGSAPDEPSDRFSSGDVQTIKVHVLDRPACTDIPKEANFFRMRPVDVDVGDIVSLAVQTSNEMVAWNIEGSCAYRIEARTGVPGPGRACDDVVHQNEVLAQIGGIPHPLKLCYVRYPVRIGSGAVAS